MVLFATIVAGGLAYLQFSPLPKYPLAIPDLPTIEYTPERVARGEKLVGMLCAGCHLNRETRKLTGRGLREVSEFGTINSSNITQDPKAGIGQWSDAELIYFIRTGIHPKTSRYVPPYMPKLINASDEDLRSIVAFLRSEHPWTAADLAELPKSEPSFLSKFLSRVAFFPNKYPEQPILDPDTSNLVAWGKYIMLYQLECFACHSKDFKTNNYLVPEQSPGFFGGGNPMKDMEGQPIVSSNITLHPEAGIGQWTLAQFGNAVRSGIVPSGPALRFPMEPYTQLTDREIEAMWTYLQTVPKLDNKVAR